MRKWRERILVGASWVAAFGVLAVVGVLVVFLVARSAHILGPQLLFGDVPWTRAVFAGARVFDGIWPAVVGTLTLVALSAGIAIPLGLAAGIHVSEYAGPRFKASVTLVVDVLAGIPSIVMGLFGFSMILLLRRTVAQEAKTGLLLAAVCIALLVLPYMIRATQSALAGLPMSIRLLGPSLGMSQTQTLRRVLVPAASRGILSGAILSVGRAAEDTAVIMLTGAVATAGGRGPQDLLGKFEALPFKIFVIAAEHNTAAELDQGFGAALVLLTLTATLFIGAYLLQRSLERRWNN